VRHVERQANNAGRNFARKRKNVIGHQPLLYVACRFMMRGNIFDMAIAVIVGGAFASIVNSFVTDVFMPPMGLIGGVNFDQVSGGVLVWCKPNFWMQWIFVLKQGQNKSSKCNPTHTYTHIARSQHAVYTDQTIDAAKADGAVTMNIGRWLNTIFNFVLIGVCCFLFIQGKVPQQGSIYISCMVYYNRNNRAENFGATNNCCHATCGDRRHSSARDGTDNGGSHILYCFHKSYICPYMQMCTECLEPVKVGAKRCPHCTSYIARLSISN
jgi:large-conductance mechanosensitive channel